MAHNKLVIQLRGEKVEPELPELARIFLGDKKTDPKKPGKEIPGLRVEFNDKRGLNIPRLQSVWREVYGAAEPTRLDNIYFFGYEPQDVLSSYLETWAKSGAGNPLCTVRCNGETILREYTDKGFNRSQQPCRQMTPGGCKCRLNARINFWLPQFMEAADRVIGYFLITIHSPNSYKNVLGGLVSAFNTGGIASKPFSLYRQEETMTDPEGRPGKHWILHLERMPEPLAPALPAGSAEQLRIAAVSAPPQPDIAPEEAQEADDWIELNGLLKVVEHRGKTWYQLYTTSGEILQTDEAALLEPIINDFSLYPAREERYILPGQLEATAGEKLGNTRRLLKIQEF